MTLIIDDPELDALAEELRVLTNAASVDEVVREALTRQVDAARRRQKMLDGIAAAQAMARRIGKNDPEVDLKAYMDELSGGI